MEEGGEDEGRFEGSYWCFRAVLASVVKYGYVISQYFFLPDILVLHQ